MIELITKAPFGYRNAVLPSDMGTIIYRWHLTSPSITDSIHQSPLGSKLLIPALSHTKYRLPLSRQSTIVELTDGSGEHKDFSRFEESKVISEIRLFFLPRVFQVLGIWHASTQRGHETSQHSL